jgi:hypothetical protein
MPKGGIEMAKSLPEGWHSVTPRLVVHDPAKLVRFLKHAFGATGDFATDAPPFSTSMSMTSRRRTGVR